MFKDRMRFKKTSIISRNTCLRRLSTSTPVLTKSWERPNLYTSFISKINEKAYLPTKNIALLKNELVDKLEEYSESNAKMSLMLFEQAIDHITRSARIVDPLAG